MADKLRVAIVGLDHWYIGLGELEVAARSSRVDVVALAHRDAAKAETTASRFGVPYWSTSYSEVAQHPDADLVLTACYTSENRALCEAAARAGKHIVSVKPIAMTTGDAEAIARAVVDAGVHFLSFESYWRLQPVYRRIRQWVSEGRIGEVVSAYTLLRSGLPTTPWPGEQGKTWWLDAEKAPGGGWIDHSIYHVDFLRWLLPSEASEVSGVVANLKHKELPFEDYGVANLGFQSGVQATIDVTWTGPAGGSISQVHVVGTAGQIVYDPTLTGKLAVSGKFDLNGWVLTPPPARAGSVIEHMAEVIQSQVTPVATVDDAVRNLAVCLAFYEAAHRGTTVSLGS